jgi:outer membrane protein OmpA-like peptidoglycan-associated protein
MGMNRIVRMFFGSAMLVSLLIASGCASRGYVRTQVGESSDGLTTRIDEGDSRVEGQVEEARTELSGEISNVADETAAQAARIDETQAELDSTQQDVADARSRADEAMARADEANAEIVTLSELFGDRNTFRVDLTRDFLFSFDRAEFEAPEGAEMTEVAEAIEGNPNAVIVLEGRTDSTGDADYNIRLGERRIEAVRRFLVVEMGVPVYRIYSFSYGAAMPRASNEDADGRSQNRAVTMQILTPVESDSARVGAIDE